LTLLYNFYGLCRGGFYIRPFFFCRRYPRADIESAPTAKKNGYTSEKCRLCLHERQLYAIERFSVLHENNLFFCIIVLDKTWG